MYSSAAPLLKRLHGLLVEKRIEYKIASITHQAITAESPSYLNELLAQHKPTRCLRSSDKFLLDVPNSHPKCRGAFRTAAPSVWNNLPEELRAIRCHDAFKRNLKTVLFEAAHSVSWTRDAAPLYSCSVIMHCLINVVTEIWRFTNAYYYYYYYY